jgi:hypothetical protein
MRSEFAVAAVLGGLGVLSVFANGQKTPAKQPNLVQLEQTMEVATTTEGGFPAALRFTLTNNGNVAVDMPTPAIDCQGPNGTIRVRSVVRLDGPGSGCTGHSCASGIGDGPSFGERVKSTWLHLLPGEYLTFTGDRRFLVDRVDGPATYEYWAVYEPPSLTPEQRNELAQRGYLVPTDKAACDHLSYSQH